MLSPSLAFTWVVWRQHRWGMLFAVCGLLLAGTLAALIPWLCPKDVAGNLFGSVILPLLSLTVYPLVIFTYGLDAGDVSARESCFPTGLFRLPTCTRTLVVWPMALGAATMFVLWLATSNFILRPWLGTYDVEMPLWWPSMMAVAILAWLQALLWAPFGLPWLRTILVLIMVQVMIMVPIFGLLLGVSEASLVALFASLAAVAWGFGYVGVTLARRGDVPNWEGIFTAPSQLLRGQSQSRLPFASSTSAQVWFEWRLVGKALPIMTGVMLFVACLPLMCGLAVRDGGQRGVQFGGEVAQSFLCTLAVPVFLAGLAGWLGSRRSRWVEGRSGMMPFIATLPMTTAELVGAMFKASAWTTLATFAVIAVAWPLAVVLTGNLGNVSDWWRHDLEPEIHLRIAALIVAIALVLLVWTWKRSLDRLYVGLIESKWIEGTVVWGSIPVTYFLCVFTASIYVEPSGHFDITLTAWPWLVGTLFIIRLLTATLVLREVLRQGILQPKTVACWVGAWLLLASVVFGLLAWALAPSPVPVYALALGVVFVLPMVRLAAAPLAVAWGRHR